MDVCVRGTNGHHARPLAVDSNRDDVRSVTTPIGPGFEEVLTAAQLGAPWALRRLYDDVAPVVTGYLRLRGASEPDDVASETFLHVFDRLPTFAGDERAFRSWVFTIAHRRLIDERRRRGRRLSTQPLGRSVQPVGGNVEEEVLQDLGASWVGDLLNTLGPEQRDVLLLRIVADLSVDEVATIMGKRPGAVRALQHRALARLRRELEARQDALVPSREG